jgi:TrmH family RNA methyltransferase
LKARTVAGHITSGDNPRFRQLSKLHQSSRERRSAGLSLLDGIHLVSAYVDHVGSPETLVISTSALNNREIASLLENFPGSDTVVLADGLFRELSTVATPTGILAVVKTPVPRAPPSSPGPCVMLEDIQDPGNLGSIIRSAAAAGVAEIYVSRNSVQAWSPRVLRAGMGAHFALAIFEGVELEPLAQHYPGRVLAAAGDGMRDVYSVDLRGNVAFVFGNEGSGLTPGLKRAAHETISIPMPGKAESLNVAAAAAICLFERVRQSRTTNSE